MLIPKQKLEQYFSLHPQQMQPCGIDLTLKEVLEFKSMGEIDFDNKNRKISECKKIEIEGEKWVLAKGGYKIVFNEIVSVPPEAAGFCFPRSSLLRCGAALHCAVWDPGYKGRGEALLEVLNPCGITLHKNARIGQLVFIKAEEPPKELYRGRYLNENIQPSEK